MGIEAYSDLINHAMAFAAKHHEGEPRKGTQLPFLTHPANVGIILARYGRDETTIVAGLLHDVIEDGVREGWTRAMLEERIGAKFGQAALETVLAVTEQKTDQRGEKLPWEVRKAAYLEGLAKADERARWVCAADKIHNARATLSDLKRAEDPADVWNRFRRSRYDTVGWYRRVYERLKEVGFDSPIMEELGAAVVALERTGSEE